MISRIWHGWTTPRDADAYEALLRDEMFPEIQRIPGARGAYLLRREAGDEVEFMTITQFDDMDAVRAFAGPELTRAVIHPAAHALLRRYDAHSVHYEMRISPL